MNKNLLKKRVGNIYSVKYECRFTSDYCTTSPSAYNFYRRLFSFSFPFFFLLPLVEANEKKKKALMLHFHFFFFWITLQKHCRNFVKSCQQKKNMTVNTIVWIVVVVAATAVTVTVPQLIQWYNEFSNSLFFWPWIQVFKAISNKYIAIHRTILAEQI